MPAIAAVGRWWGFVIRGIAAILFGLLTFTMPRMALLTLVFLFGAYAIVEGASNIAAAFQGGGSRGRAAWLLGLEGVVSVIAGILAFVIPGITALWLLLVIAAWAIIKGILEIAAAFRLRREIRGEWLLGLSGVLSLAFGLLVMARPGVGALAVLIWIGAYAIIFGGVLIALGVEVRSFTRSDRPHSGFGELAPNASR